MQVIGNAGYKLSWAADPTPAPYWMNRALEHGFLRCTVNGTAFGCEVMVYLTPSDVFGASTIWRKVLYPILDGVSLSASALAQYTAQRCCHVLTLMQCLL